jgi:hypothetical protein
MGDHAEMFHIAGDIEWEDMLQLQHELQSNGHETGKRNQHLRCSVQSLTLPKYSFDTGENVKNNSSDQKLQ